MMTEIQNKFETMKIYEDPMKIDEDPMKIDENPMDALMGEMEKMTTNDPEYNWDKLNEFIMFGREILYTSCNDKRRVDEYLNETSKRYKIMLKSYKDSDHKETREFCDRMKNFFKTPSKENKIIFAHSLDMSLYEYISNL